MALGTKLTATLVVAGALAGAPALSAVAATAKSGTTGAPMLYREAVASTRAWSVHYSSSSKVLGSTSVLTLTGDAGPASGTQTVTLGAGSISIDVIGGISYLYGNANGLQNLAGLSPTQASASAGQWIEFATTNGAFASVVVGVRSADLVKELALSGKITKVHPSTVDGLTVDAVQGLQTLDRRNVRVVLYVRATGAHVPVEEDSVNDKGQRISGVHIAFSHWGERVRPQAPQATITVGPVSST